MLWFRTSFYQTGKNNKLNMLPVARVIMAFMLMGGVVASVSLDEYRRLFPDVSTVTWDAPTGENDNHVSPIYAVTTDLASEKSVLAAVRNFVVQLNTDPSPTSVHLLGNLSENGYTEGRGTEARFNLIVSLVYVKSRDTVILSDFANHCLREFNRNELLTSPFAGQCTVEGDQDGHRLQAKFNRVHTIDYDEITDTLWLTTRETRKIKTISLATDLVTTVADLSTQASMIYGFSRLPSSPDNMIVLTNTNFLVNSTSGFVIGEPCTEIRRIAALTPGLYIMSRWSSDGNLEVYLLDIQLNHFLPLCLGSDFNPDNEILNCPAKARVFDVYVSKGHVYLPSYNNNQWTLTIIKVNCSEMSWTEWGPCNVSTGLGVQSRYRYSCEQEVEKRVCWKSTQDVFVHLRGQCTIGEKITPAKRRPDCAAHCLNDEQCQGFIMSSASQECSTATVTGGGNYDCYLKRTNS